MSEESGEFRERELFGASVRAKAAVGESVLDAGLGGDGAQIVSQSLPFMRETALEKFEEAVVVLNAEGRASAGQRHGHKGGGDLWRRLESSRGNAQLDFWACVELAKSGQIAVIAATGPRDDPRGNLELDHDHDGRNACGGGEEALKDRRSNVVGKIAIHMNVRFAEERRQIESQDVPGDDFNIWPFQLGAPLESGKKTFIGLNGQEAADLGREQFRHFAVAGADFEPRIARAQRKRLEDALAPCRVFQEVLAEPLTRHGRASVAMRGAGHKLIRP